MTEVTRPERPNQLVERVLSAEPEATQGWLSWAGKALLSSPVPYILAVTTALALVVENQYILHLLVTGLLFGASAMAFDFAAGYINVVNFGYAAFMGLGGYTAGLLSYYFGANPWLGMLAGTIAAGILGFFTGILTLRLRGMYAAVLSWFVGLALMAVATVWVDVTRGAWGVWVPVLIESGDKRAYYFAMLPLVVLTYVVVQLITKSPIGLAFKAIGQNRDAALASGIRITHYLVFNFTVSCALAGMIGGAMAYFIGTLNPEIMHTKHTMEVLILAYVGGRGSIWGGLLAGFTMIPLFEYLKPLFEIRLIIYGLLLIVLMIFFPGGFQGLVSGVLSVIRRWHRAE
jgi:branched-chain amino acid transport system permease protein